MFPFPFPRIFDSIPLEFFMYVYVYVYLVSRIYNDVALVYNLLLSSNKNCGFYLWYFCYFSFLFAFLAYVFWQSFICIKN